MSTARFNRWPEVGQLLEIIKEMGGQRDGADTRPVEWREAERRAAEWYESLLRSRAP